MNQPSAEHLQGVINRLSMKLGAIMVENSSLQELIVEKEQRIRELEAATEQKTPINNKRNAG